MGLRGASEGSSHRERVRLWLGSFAVGLLIALAAFSMLEAEHADRQGRDSVLDRLTGATRASRQQPRRADRRTEANAAPTGATVPPPPAPQQVTSTPNVTPLPSAGEQSSALPALGTTVTSASTATPIVTAAAEKVWNTLAPAAAALTEFVSGLDWVPPLPFVGVADKGDPVLANRTFDAAVWQRVLKQWKPTVVEAPLKVPSGKAGGVAAAPSQAGAKLRWKPAVCSFAELRTSEYAKRGCRGSPHPFGYCDADQHLIRVPDGQLCQFWGRTRWTEPMTEARLEGALDRMEERRKTQSAARGQPRCDLTTLTDSLLHPDGSPGRKARFVRKSKAEMAFDIEADGCWLDDTLVDDPDAAIASLWRISDRGRRPIVVSGDSVMRQAYARLVLALRGERDPARPWKVYHPGSIGVWGDMVYVVRKHDDELAIVHPGTTRFPEGNSRGPHIPGQRSFCWDGRREDSKLVRTMPNVTGRTRPGETTVCVRTQEDLQGPVWCDPDDVENPCLLRVHMLFVSHEGYFLDTDFGRVQHAVYRDPEMRRPFPGLNYDAHLPPLERRCRVDCKSLRTGRGDDDAVPYALHDKSQVPGVIHESNHRYHGPPMHLAFDDIPALHIHSNMYWLDEGRDAVPDDQLLPQYARYTNHFIGKLHSFRGRLWRADTCDQPPDADCKAVPPYKMLWLTVPPFRDRGANASSNVAIRYRNAIMRDAMRRDANPGLHHKERLRFHEGTLGARDAAFWKQREEALLLGTDDLATVVPPNRTWGFLADLGALGETLPKPPKGPSGADKVHLMCSWVHTIYKRDRQPIYGDNTGCRGDLERWYTTWVLSVALGMGEG